jgi:uncharacterized membrane protein
MKRVAIASVVAAVTMIALDLAWLGLVARPFYDSALGPLRRPAVHAPAAALFYVMYIAFAVGAAALPAATESDAARRGAAMGLLAYGTYELTNLAVIAAWPAQLVLVDVAWGMALTAAVAAAARWAAGPHGATASTLRTADV